MPLGGTEPIAEGRSVMTFSVASPSDLHRDMQGDGFQSAVSCAFGSAQEAPSEKAPSNLLCWEATQKGLHFRPTLGALVPKKHAIVPAHHPKDLCGVIFNLLPYEEQITLRGNNNLANVNFMLVLKGIFGGSLKITLQNRKNPQSKK